MLEKEFNPDMLYSRIVHHYMDKKGYDKTRANAIAQNVVQREAQKRICRTKGCGHFSHDHIRNTEACLVTNCTCRGFTNASGTKRSNVVSTEAVAAITREDGKTGTRQLIADRPQS